MSTKQQTVRQQAAAERKAVRDARSTEEQIALIKKRPGKSAKELARLTKKSG